MLEWAIRLHLLEPGAPGDLETAVSRLIDQGVSEAQILAELGIGPGWRADRDEHLAAVKRAEQRAAALAINVYRLPDIATALGAPGHGLVQVRGAVGAWGQVVVIGPGEGHTHALVGRRWDAAGTGWDRDEHGRIWRLLDTAPTIGSAQATAAELAEGGPAGDPHPRR